MLLLLWHMNKNTIISPRRQSNSICFHAIFIAVDKLEDNFCYLESKFPYRMLETIPHLEKKEISCSGMHNRNTAYHSTFLPAHIHTRIQSYRQNIMS